jgi:hypothetical protein
MGQTAEWCADSNGLAFPELASSVFFGGKGPREDEFWPTAHRVRQEIDSVLATRLSDQFSRWVEGYGKVGKRSPYLWPWCRRAVELTTLPCVPTEFRSELCDTKVLGVMLDVMWDDIADQDGNHEFLEKLLSLPVRGREVDFSGFPPPAQAYADFSCLLWLEIEARARRYPRFAEFEQLFRFDYGQLCNVMRYSHLLNAMPNLLNLTEHDLYTPHNMHIMICSTLDLMCSPGFDVRELGRLREVIWNAQWMGRIGNLVTTWQRELKEGDFTSGVYASAISSGDLSVADLESGDPARIEAAILQGGHEGEFLRRWQAHRRFLLSERAFLRSFDVGHLVASLERLVCLHLGSRGYK